MTAKPETDLRDAVAPQVTEALTTFQKQRGYYRPVIEELLIDFGGIVAGLMTADLAKARADLERVTAERDGLQAIVLADDAKAVAEYEWERANKLASERDEALSKAALDENAAAAWKRKAQEAECTVNDLVGIDQRAAEYCRERDTAEAETTRLRTEVERLEAEKVRGHHYRNKMAAEATRLHALLVDAGEALKLAENPLSYRHAIDPSGPGSTAVARGLTAVRTALAALNKAPTPKEPA